jgi:hypothetical protein
MSEFWPSFNEDTIQNFLRGTAPDPVPTALLNTAAAMVARQTIQGFIDQVMSLPEDKYACRSVYLDFEQDRLASLDLILNAQHTHIVKTANNRLYGAFDEIGGNEAVSYLAHHIHELIPASSEVDRSRKLLLSVWKQLPPYASVSRHFDSIERLRLSLRPFVERTYGFMNQIMESYQSTPLLSSKASQSVVAAGIEHILGAKGSRWHATVKPGAPNVFIDFTNQAVVIPADRFYSKEHIASLVIHEVGVHVQRAVNGDASAERLAGYGLPGYGSIEEAFGVLLGNATKHDYRQMNSLIPFALIWYAGQPNSPSFRQTYEFAQALIICLSNPDEKKFEAKSAEYSRAAFSRVLRILRLGNSALIERSTTKYWAGLVSLSDYFETHILNDQALDEFFLGKYNPNSQLQLSLMKHHSRH